MTRSPGVPALLALSLLAAGCTQRTTAGPGTRAAIHETERPSQLVPGLTAGSARVACTATDDSEARALWERAAAPHRGPWDTVGLAAYVSFHAGPVAPERRGLPPPDSTTGWVMALDGSHAVDDIIARSGYAWHPEPGLRPMWEGQDFGYWYYPRFNLFNAYHLTSALFGRLNRFVVVHRTADEARIAFCSTDQQRPFVMGVLTLREGRIHHALWRFATHEYVDHAGGEATFQPNPNAAILTPALGVQWRTRGQDAPYTQQRYLVIHEYLTQSQLRARSTEERPPS